MKLHSSNRFDVIIRDVYDSNFLFYFLLSIIENDRKLMSDPVVTHSSVYAAVVVNAVKLFSFLFDIYLTIISRC